MGKLHRTLLLFLTVWTLVLMPVQAMAAADLTCNQALPAGGKLWNTDTIADGFCAARGSGLNFTYHPLSTIVCNVVYILNDVLGRVYCSLQFDMRDTLSAALSLYIAVFGAQLLMGTAQLNTKEIMTRLLKIAGVWSFATYSVWGIGLAFNFFIDIVFSGVYWVLQSIPNNAFHDPTSACYDAYTSGATGVMGVFSMLDEAMCNALRGSFISNNAKVIAFFAFISYNGNLPIFGMAVYWVWKNFIIMVRALVSFLLGISALAFLISLSPIFLSMMLFQSTLQFFENWLKYMISFSLQIIIVFACLAMWITLTMLLIDFFTELASLIFPYNKIWAGAQMQDPVSYYGLCQFQITAGPLGPVATCTANTPLIPMSMVPRKADLMYYLAYHLSMLILMAYAFDALLRDAPNIAQQLAGPQYIPALGMGFGVNKGGMIRGGQNLTNRISGGGALSLANTAGGGGANTRSLVGRVGDMVSGALRRGLR